MRKTEQSKEFKMQLNLSNYSRSDEEKKEKKLNKPLIIHNECLVPVFLMNII